MGRSLCRIIDRARPENLRCTVDVILRRGSYELADGKRMRIHPDALKTLRHAWLTGSQQSCQDINEAARIESDLDSYEHGHCTF